MDFCLIKQGLNSGRIETKAVCRPTFEDVVGT